MTMQNIIPTLRGFSPDVANDSADLTKPEPIGNDRQTHSYSFSSTLAGELSTPALYCQTSEGGFSSRFPLSEVFILHSISYEIKRGSLSRTLSGTHRVSIMSNSDKVLNTTHREAELTVSLPNVAERLQKLSDSRHITTKTPTYNFVIQ